MQHRLSGAITAVAVLALAGTAFAATTPAATTAPARSAQATAAPAAHPGHATGTLVSVDSKANTLVLQVNAEKITFALAPATSYLNAGQAIDATKLPAGSRLRVEYHKNGTTRAASKVEVLPAAAPKKP